MRVIGVDRKNCGLLEPSNPIRSRWRVRFKVGPGSPAYAWRQQFEHELEQRVLRRKLRYRYAPSPDPAGARYRYTTARPLGRLWRKVRAALIAPRLYVDVDVPPGRTHVQLARQELGEVIAATNEYIRRTKDQNTQAHVARRAALKSLGRALATVDRRQPLPPGEAAVVLDLTGRQALQDVEARTRRSAEGN